MKEVSCVLKKIFYIVFFLFNVAIFYYAFEQHQELKQVYTVYLIEKIVIIVMMFLIILACSRLKEKEKWKKDLLIIFFGSILLRFLIILFMGIETNQISDFKVAYEMAIGITNDKGVIFPTWGMYPIYLEVFMRIFGKSVLSCIIGNAVLSSMSCCLIYTLCRSGALSRRVAVLASVLFCVWPSYLTYTIVLTPEHINITLTLISINLLLLLHKVTEGKKYILISLSAIFLAVAFFFKSVSLIVIIALGIIFILELLQMWGNWKKLVNVKREFFKIIIKITCFLIFYFASVDIGYHIIEAKYGKPVNKDVSVYYLAVGLNVESKGAYSPDLKEKFLNSGASSFDYDSANEALKEYMKENSESLKREWREIFVYKFNRAWGNDDYISFIKKTINVDGKALINAEQFANYAKDGFHIYYFMIIGICLGASVVNVFKNNDNKLIFFSALFIFGLMCLLVISEAQARYKCVVYPYFSIIAAYGIEIIGDFINIKMKNFGGGKLENICK